MARPKIPQGIQGPTVKLVYEPLAKQNQFHGSGAKYKVYAGGRGAGKTLCGAAEAITLLTEFPRNYGLIGRLTMPELKKTAMKEVLEFPVFYEGKTIPFVTCPLVKKWDKQNSEITLVNDSVAFFTHLDDVTWKQRGLNLGFVWIDELTEINEEDFNWLGSNLRRKGVRRVIFGTTNPEGHDWVWKKFISEKNQDHFIVTATSNENPHLPDDYVEDLKKTMPEEWIKRFVYCNFDTYSGLVYSEWRDKAPFVLKYHETDNDHYKFIALDYGYRVPTGVLWGEVDRAGNVAIFDELYVKEMLISDIANLVKAKTGRMKIQLHLIDPSCRNRDGRTGRSVIDEYSDYGLNFESANNNVNAGINHVKEYFKLNAQGQPKLKITENCVHLRQELQMYRWRDLKVDSVDNPKEKPIKKDDHLLDPLRYIANYLYVTPSLTKKRKDFDYKRDILNKRRAEQSSEHWMAQ